MHYGECCKMRVTLASYLFKPKRQNRQSTVGREHGSCSSKSLHLSGISIKCWYLSKAALVYFLKGTCKLHFKLFKDSECLYILIFQNFTYKLPAPQEKLLKQDFILLALCRIFVSGELCKVAWVKLTNPVKSHISPQNFFEKKKKLCFA